MEATQEHIGFETGTLLQGTYQILHLLGSGGMGRVYAASHARLPGLFAVKALHKEYAKNENAIIRFRGEAEIMAGLRHPNIVQVFDYNVAEDGTPYLVMEFIEGTSLGDKLRSGEKMSPERVASIVPQIAGALEVAHRRGVVHRDLKPDNIMVTSPDGQEDFIKVVDFGISKAVGSSRITAETTILGTPQYMAPEQAQGRHEDVDHRTDQFALAAMTYALLAGVEPFQGQSPVTVLYQVVHEAAKPIAQRIAWRCNRVDAVLQKAMSKANCDRYSTILEFSSALVAAIAADLSEDAPPAGAQNVESFVRAPQTGLVTVVAPRSRESRQIRRPTVDSTMVIDRPRRRGMRPATGFAAAGLAAAALLAVFETGANWQRVWSLLSGSFLPAASAPAADNVIEGESTPLGQ